MTEKLSERIFRSVETDEEMIEMAKKLEATEVELNQIKGYMGVGYPIFKKALEDCIKGERSK